jgi:hypothetical protein
LNFTPPNTDNRTASIEIFVPKSLLILFVNAALFLSAQKVKKERYPLEVKAQEGQE